MGAGDRDAVRRGCDDAVASRGDPARTDRRQALHRQPARAGGHASPHRRHVRRPLVPCVPCSNRVQHERYRPMLSGRTGMRPFPSICPILRVVRGSTMRAARRSSRSERSSRLRSSRVVAAVCSRVLRQSFAEARYSASGSRRGFNGDG
ncbi:type II secretion system protein [Burkholderia cenocepacia PC184]|nr:type II secretion system protein [Burkholderia cenocepacia PC184]